MYESNQAKSHKTNGDARYHAVVPSTTIRHPYGLKAEVDIEPSHVSPGFPATQTVRIYVDKTCESINGYCRAAAANGWVTFNTQPHWTRFFNPQGGTRSFWTRRSLPPFTCLIALAEGILAPQEKPETVTVRLEASDDSNRPVFGVPDAVFKLAVEY